MEIFSNGWYFSFDKRITEAYYNSLDDYLCGCATCRNFYSNTSQIPADLLVFLEQFGINPAKPIELWPRMESVNKKDMLVDNIACYAVNGDATSSKRHEIDFGAASVAVDFPKPTDPILHPEFPEPFFIFTVTNLWLPWTVSDDIEE
ncbi:MAG: hypothetical protein FWD99_09460 [Oscillospiraceae bacterium]|nr:hypothetical protein [Oscillospiraceae bacterium]